jgi:hypothetical protein
MRLVDILLFSLLLVILIGGFLYYALPYVLFRPRIDPIPAGAYIVPWMNPNPSIASLVGIPLDQLPWNIDTAMTGALKLNITFTIPLPGQTLVVPSTVYLGHDAEYLYVGGSFSGIGPDPFSTPQTGYPDYFDILFDVADSGALTFPEAGSVMSVIVAPPGSEPVPYGWVCPTITFYQELGWQNYISAVGYASWDFAQGHGMNAVTVGDMVTEYDNSTGTLVILFSRHLGGVAGYYKNSFQMSPGERFVMGFLLQLGFAGEGSSYNIYQGSWPESNYFWSSNNSSSWPKLVIGLTNPPATYPGDAPARYPSAGLQACEGTGLNLMSPFLMSCSSALRISQLQSIPENCLSET